MIEGSTDDGEYLVQVSAQVMTRDESTGGWVPMGGGGLSKVKLCKLAPLDDVSPTSDRQQVSQPDTAYRLKPEYVIYGERFEDKTVILDCRLKKDIQYTKANPKWHHWKTDEKRYGLTFERTEDAKAFDQGIRSAVKDLTEGLSDGNSQAVGDEGDFAYMQLPIVPRKDSSSRSASTTSTTTSSPGTNSPQSPLNNDPFLFTHPHSHLHRVHYISNERTSGRLPTNGSGFSVQQRQPQSQPLWHHPHHHHHQHLHHPHQCQTQTGTSVSEKSDWHKSSFDSSSGQEEVWVRPSYDPSAINGKSDQGLLDCPVDNDGDYKDLYKDESYVVFEKDKAGGTKHEYSYPNLEPAPKTPAIRSSMTKKVSTSSSHSTQPYPHPPLPIKKSKSKNGNGDGKTQSGVKNKLISPQVQCKNCRELFSQDNNPRGSCEDAPDSVARCIECVSCVRCTSCLMYHCWADADGEFRHPCSCDTGDPNQCKRWTALTLLSLIFPCLWCYIPLKTCHHCGSLCGVCGGQHKAA